MWTLPALHLDNRVHGAFSWRKGAPRIIKNKDLDLKRQSRMCWRSGFGRTSRNERCVAHNWNCTRTVVIKLTVGNGQRRRVSTCFCEEIEITQDTRCCRVCFYAPSVLSDKTVKREKSNVNYYFTKRMKSPRARFKDHKCTRNRVIHRQCLVYCGFEGQRADHGQGVANKKKMLYGETTLNRCRNKFIAAPGRTTEFYCSFKQNRCFRKHSMSRYCVQNIAALCDGSVFVNYVLDC